MPDNQVTDQDILDFALDVSSDKPMTEVATTTDTVVAPEVIETEQVAPEANPNVEEPLEFTISDEVKGEAQSPETETEVVNGTENNFDAMYQERIAQDLGLDLDTLKSKLAQFSELETKANSNVYKSEQGKIFDELLSKGVPVETIVNVAFRDLKDADDLQILDYQMQLKYPNSTAEERQAYLEEEYKTSDEYLDKEKLAGSFKLKQDASNARKELDGLRASALQSPYEKEKSDYVAKEMQRVELWQNGLSKKVVDGFNSLERKVKLNYSFDGKPIEKEATVRIPISAKDKQQMESFLNENVQHWSNATGDINGQAFAKEVLQNKYIVENIDKIVQGAVNNALSFVTEQQKTYLHNYQAPRNNAQAPQGAKGSESTDTETLQYALDAFNS